MVSAAGEEGRRTLGNGYGTGAGGLRLLENHNGSQYVFLVVNPLSGGGAAKQFLNLGFNYLEWTAHGDDPARLRKLLISDIRKGESGNKDIFHIIRSIVTIKKANPDDSAPNLRLIVAGGDGTMMWAFSELQKHGIDRGYILCGIVPFGTGNDFANAFGAHLPIQKAAGETNVRMMKRLCEHWLNFRPQLFDLWKISVQADPDGNFKKIDQTTRAKKLLSDHNGKPLRALTFTMANYFSIGVESRIGIGFERNRTDNALLNRGAYAMEGVKKFAFHRRRVVNSFLESVAVAVSHGEGGLGRTRSSGGRRRFPPLPLLGSPSLAENQMIIFHCGESKKASRSRSFFLRRKRASDLHQPPLQSFTFAASTSMSVPDEDHVTRSDGALLSKTPHTNSLDSSKERLQYNVPVLTPSVSLVVLNIPSFAGGLDLWQGAEKKLGLKPPAIFTKASTEHWNRLVRDSMMAKQDIGDGKLEVLAFQSLLELGLSNLMRVMTPSMAPGGWRLYHGDGKLCFNFRPNLRKDTRIYFQIDGEYFIGTKLTKIEVERDCQVRVLVAAEQPRRFPIGWTDDCKRSVSNYLRSPSGGSSILSKMLDGWHHPRSAPHQLSDDESSVPPRISHTSATDL